ncbi:MAG: hypothetical protein K2Y10_05720 [Burkholderiaceae bacterium]|nr:hypothetical protein [Burkholderiaceae bacterium]
MMGGRPWFSRNGSGMDRIYFGQFHVRGGEWFLQGNEGWKRQGPAQFPDLTDAQISQFPNGYFDVKSGEWVIEGVGYKKDWPGDSYKNFMNASLARRTFAPLVPQKEILTRDGLIMEPGLEVMFVGGKLLHRHHWDTEKLLGRRMIAQCRASTWCYGKDGKLTSYGTDYIKVREYASHAEPKCWHVLPHPDDDDFVIQGRGVDTTRSWLPIEDPEVSLVAIDGRRLVTVIPKIPEKEPLIQA